MITLRLPAGIEADCSTVDEAVELIARWQERPRVVEILKARRSRSTTNLETATGSLGRGQTEPHASPLQQGVATPDNSSERPVGNVAKPQDDPGEATCVVAPAPVSSTRDTIPAPAIEDDPAAQREDEARALMPDAPTPDDAPDTSAGKRTRSEIMRDNWAKRRAAKGSVPPDGSEAWKRRAACAENPDELPVVRRDAYGNPRGCGAAILTAFQRDARYPLAKLARHILGSASTACIVRLRSLLGREFIGKLEPLGGDAYRVTRRGEEALRAAIESAERVARMQEGSAAE